jgi:hypothetical protein
MNVSKHLEAVTDDLMKLYIVEKDQSAFRVAIRKYFNLPEEDADLTEEDSDFTKLTEGQKNDWGLEESKGFVFLDLKAGIGGRVVKIAIGRQDANSEEEGYKSALPLCDEDIEEAESKKILVMNHRASLILKKNDLKKYQELKKYNLVY